MCCVLHYPAHNALVTVCNGIFHYNQRSVVAPTPSALNVDLEFFIEPSRLSYWWRYAVCNEVGQINLLLNGFAFGSILETIVITLDKFYDYCYGYCRLPLSLGSKLKLPMCADIDEASFFIKHTTVVKYQIVVTNTDNQCQSRPLHYCTTRLFVPPIVRLFKSLPFFIVTFNGSNKAIFNFGFNAFFAAGVEVTPYLFQYRLCCPHCLGSLGIYRGFHQTGGHY